MGAETIGFKRGKLPHWLVADRSYFVTICRKGCLPASVLEELVGDRDDALSKAAAMRPPDTWVGDVGLIAPDLQGEGDGVAVLSRAAATRPPDATPDLQSVRLRKIETIMDSAKCAVRDLAEPQTAGVIVRNIDWLRTRGWRVWAATVMPSHLHLVLRHAEGGTGGLESDLGQFKNYTARVVNAMRGGQGTFWQRESFDHWCRNSTQWLGYIRYTVWNPVTAGLVRHWREWPWTVVDPEVEALVEATDGPM